MSEKLNDVKKLLTEYINKHNGTLYVYDSLLVCFCQPYMIIYEDDKRDGTHNCSIQIDGSLIVSMAYDLDGEFIVHKRRNSVMNFFNSFSTNLCPIKEISDYAVYFQNQNLKTSLCHIFQDHEYTQYLQSIDFHEMSLKEKTLQVQYPIHQNNARFLKVKDIENLIEQLYQTQRVFNFYKKRSF